MKENGANLARLKVKYSGSLKEHDFLTGKEKDFYQYEILTEKGTLVARVQGTEEPGLDNKIQVENLARMFAASARLRCAVEDLVGSCKKLPPTEDRRRLVAMAEAVLDELDGKPATGTAVASATPITRAGIHPDDHCGSLQLSDDGKVVDRGGQPGEI